jgi:hypothetical protein
MGAKATSTVTAQIRAEIEKSAQSLRSIATATGIDVTQLSRWLRGERGLTGTHIDILADYFHLQLTKRK